jgi:D-alanine-D-alanine ligase
VRILVLTNEPGEEAGVEERDVLAQRDAVAAALTRLGYETTCLGCTLDLAALQRQLTAARPDAVFNLVESLGGTDRLMPLATLLLEALRIPHTGAGTEAILATSNKPAAKARMRAGGLPTPDWLQLDQSVVPFEPSEDRWILKPIWEHASFGMEDDAVVVAPNAAALAERLRDRERRVERPHFAERFVPGREFNLSLLAGEVLPPAEIDFSSYPVGKPRIVGRRAKWDAESFEYTGTPRRFDFPADDDPLLRELTQLALRCGDLFGLTGYARVDFRVDETGQPWILEINANPCLTPDAGFAAALERAGLGYEEGVRRILNEALG